MQEDKDKLNNDKLDKDILDNENIDRLQNEELIDQEIDPIVALNAENENLAADNSELKDRLLRTIAEMENLRKRTAREVGEARTYAIANFARDMLSATDNLSRALSVVPKEALENGDAALISLVDGIKMTEREMQRLMQANGIKPILSLGEKFDPHKHQAMFEVPNSGQPDGVIVEEMQPGFAIGERILRPALVGIAKGSSEPKKEEKLFENMDIENIASHIDKKA